MKYRTFRYLILSSLMIGAFGLLAIGYDRTIALCLLAVGYLTELCAFTGAFATGEDDEDGDE